MILHLTLANQELDARKGPINENSGVVKGDVKKFGGDHDATLRPPSRSRSHSNQPAVVAPPRWYASVLSRMIFQPPAVQRNGGSPNWHNILGSETADRIRPEFS